jgi:predicted house-cleaning noncanonical NTP pyrophosphatase (MazG superfamily)
MLPKPGTLPPNYDAFAKLPKYLRPQTTQLPEKKQPPKAIPAAAKPLKYERFGWEKLVRDKVVLHCLAQGCRIEATQLQGVELLEQLVAKLSEETAEIKTALAELYEPASYAAFIAEIADLKTVIDAICHAAGVGMEEVAAAQQRKCARKGDFTHGMFISTIDVPVGHPDIPGFNAEPEKYQPMGLVD